MLSIDWPPNIIFFKIDYSCLVCILISYSFLPLTGKLEMTILIWTSKVSDKLVHVSLTDFLVMVSWTGMSLPTRKRTSIIAFHLYHQTLQTGRTEVKWLLKNWDQTEMISCNYRFSAITPVVHYPLNYTCIND